MVSCFFQIFFNFCLVAALIIASVPTQAQAVTVAVKSIDAIEFFQLGVYKTQKKQYEQALEYFTQAIKLDANLTKSKQAKSFQDGVPSTAAYSNRCLVYIRLEDYAKAAKNCTQALQLNPDNTEAYLNRGLAYYRLGNYQAAIADYAQVIERQPDDFRVYYNRGLAHCALKNYNEAIADYERALSIDHHSSERLLADIYNDRGLAKLSLKQESEAIVDFDLAIALEPNNPRAFYNRAHAYLSQDDLLSAMRDFSIALQLTPNYAPAYVNRGLIYYKLGDRQAALRDLKIASKYFDEQGNTAAYQQTLDLVERLKQPLQSPAEWVYG